MAFNLAGVKTQLNTLMADSTNLKWSAADQEYAIKQAAGEVSFYAGTVLTLDGLDGAAVTTIPATLESALVVGAAGYLAAIRVGARADWESQSPGEPGRLATWGSKHLADFRRLVAAQYPNDGRTHTQRATTTPWGSWADDFGEVGKDDLD